MHLVTCPVSCVCFAIWPHIFTLAWDLILNEVSCVFTSISKSQNTLTIFLSIPVVSLVSCAIRPSLNSCSMLFILKPVSLVSGAICMSVCSLSMSFVIQPVTLINISIGMDEFSKSICLIVLPVSNVAGCVWPDLLSMSMLLSINSLTIVYRSICLRIRRRINLVSDFNVRLRESFCGSFWAVSNLNFIPLDCEITISWGIWLDSGFIMFELFCVSHAVVCAVAHLLCFIIKALLKSQ